MQRCVLSTARALVALILLGSGSAAAQERGFRLHRYDGTSAGSWQFLIERPWYSEQRFAAIGLSFDYSHRPLEPRVATGRGTLEPLVLHAVVGHLEVAGSLFDRVLVSASLPVTALEQGTTEPVSQVGPLTGVGLGDPRVGVMVRLFGQADRDGFSAHLGAELWIPIGSPATHQGDTGIRVAPHAVLAGAFLDVGRWTVDLGFHYRPYASFGPPSLGMTAASELRVGVGLGASLFGDHLHVGPEAQLSMQVVGDQAFATNGMNFEVLGGMHYLIADQVLVGVAGGTAFFQAAGTPDARALFRLAWAPRRETRREPVCPPGGCVEPTVGEPDADTDGVSNAADRCPFEPETKNGIRDEDGCPELEMDKGTPLARVLAPQANPPPKLKPETPAQPEKQPAKQPEKPDLGAERAAAFAASDSDGDTVPDAADRCPVTAEDLDGFEDEDGCPEPDNDGDSVADASDQCPFEAEVINGLKDDDGCPDAAEDADADGVADALDRCPFEPETIDGVRDTDGCPEPAGPAALSRLLAPPPPPRALLSAEEKALPAAVADSDSDTVPDEADRCPVTPEDADGFEDEDGCPELDNDADTVLDTADKCPDAAETINGFDDGDGCPDENPDTDGDGVSYELDRCPLEAGTAADGCPHAPLPALALPGFPGAPSMAPTTRAPAASTGDFDKDTIDDDADVCPMTPEDRDGFEDEDGCPEPDNDRDGVADAADKCPYEGEVINGIKDDDGCPDQGAGSVTVRGNAVVIDGVVPFKPGSATLQPVSSSLLKQVAGTLRAAASLSVEVQGHTDDVGSAVANIKLSKKRAEAIRAFLIRAGVPPHRLTAVGYGPMRPRTSNQSPAGREQNRRVEFLILGEAK